MPSSVDPETKERIRILHNDSEVPVRTLIELFNLSAKRIYEYCRGKSLNRVGRPMCIDEEELNSLIAFVGAHPLTTDKDLKSRIRKARLITFAKRNGIDDINSIVLPRMAYHTLMRYFTKIRSSVVPPSQHEASRGGRVLSSCILS